MTMLYFAPSQLRYARDSACCRCSPEQLDDAARYAFAVRLRLRLRRSFSPEISHFATPPPLPLMLPATFAIITDVSA